MKRKTLYGDFFNNTSKYISLEIPKYLCCDICNRQKYPLGKKRKRNDDVIMCDHL